MQCAAPFTICPEAMVTTNTPLLPLGLPCVQAASVWHWKHETMVWATGVPGLWSTQCISAASTQPGRRRSFPDILKSIANDPQSFPARGSFVGTSWIVGETQKGEWLLGRECLAGPPATYSALVFTSYLENEGKPTVWPLQKTLLTGTVLLKTT